MMSLRRYNMLSDIVIIACIVLCSSVTGNKVRACAGQEAHLTCSSGFYVDVSSAVGGFGPSGTPCTSTASCNTSYVQEALTEAYGSLGALIMSTCKDRNVCNVFINSSWQAPYKKCNNQVYNITYVDVEYQCSSVIQTTAPPSLTAKSAAGEKTTTRIHFVTELNKDDTNTANTTLKGSVTNTYVRTGVTNTTVGISVILSTDPVTIITDTEETMVNKDPAWRWYVIGSGVGLNSMIIIIIIVVLIRRKRRQQDSKSDDVENSAINNENVQSDDVTPYVTTTAASVSSNKPDIIYDAINNGEDDDIRLSTIDCYATPSNKGNDVHNPSDVSTSNDVSADVPVYASVNKAKKREIISIDTVLVDNENYTAS